MGEELRWLNEYYGVHTGRVVTVGYYALVKLNEALIASAAAEHAQWVGVERVTRLAMDHKQIMARALETLGRQLMVEPIAFELLPRKFTLRQLQVLYEAILGIEIDNRNFRKKVLSSGYLRETGEREKHVAHKPAMFTPSIRAGSRRMCGRSSGLILSIGNYRPGVSALRGASRLCGTFRGGYSGHSAAPGDGLAGRFRR